MVSCRASPSLALTGTSSSMRVCVHGHYPILSVMGTKNNQEVTANEWDLRFTFPSASWKTSAKTIKNYVASLVDNEDITFVLVSGVELGTTGFKRFQSTGVNYHVHCALITQSPITRTAAIQTFVPNWSPSETNSTIISAYAVPRAKTSTYLGWLLHHCKLKDKDHCSSSFTGVNENGLMVSFGELPRDEHTAKNMRMIHRVVDEYAPERREEVNKELSTWNIERRLKLSREDARERKRQRELVYRSSEDAKLKKRRYDMERKWKNYQQLVQQLWALDKASTNAALVHQECRKMESTKWIQELLQEKNQSPVPDLPIDDTVTDDEN